MKKKLALGVSVCLLSLGSIAQSTNEAVIWYQYNENIKLSEKWSAGLGFQYRDLVERDKDYHLFFSAGFTRILPNGFSVGAGLMNLNVNQIVAEDYLLVPEMRPYQQVGYSAKFDKISFKWRFIAEERFIRNVENGKLISGHTFSFRFRNLSEIGIPVYKGFSLTAGTEIFFNAGGAPRLNVFDQDRTALLCNFPAGEWKLSTGLGSAHWG
ncbi:MAG: DUF2490 domain-containing protein [Cyclobacteriaceae bacterium]